MGLRLGALLAALLAGWLGVLRGALGVQLKLNWKQQKDFFEKSEEVEKKWQEAPDAAQVYVHRNSNAPEVDKKWQEAPEAAEVYVHRNSDALEDPQQHLSSYFSLVQLFGGDSELKRLKKTYNKLKKKYLKKYSKQRFEQLKYQTMITVLQRMGFVP
ncbi:hypothetical protein, conserved [Eimeria tenella]|uniref:Uncharacterized protein n=1 Tax=Eimeria tenella TaxID=5802 RepID=U6KVY4_EIMTE|nr:hypothetical protein, conserved [Eimeria tenella]CDJ42131.1 hypothetical protein, conserved [Eimeria tenella]|eukprot:XP_013232881.1 hypothetical protein, conserved [Eimeria tenella]